MKTKRIVASTFALVAIGLAVAVIWVHIVVRAGPRSHAVVLANGETISGLLLPMSDSRFVLQTGDGSWIVAGRDIRQVDGEPFPHPDPVTGDLVILYETFEDVLANGDIDVHSSIQHRNESQKPIRELRWGMAPHELVYLDSFRVLDQFGNSMPLEVDEERPDGGKQVKVTLVRPLLPGEDAWYTSRFLDSKGTIRDGEEWIYRHVGDYPENRLVTRSVLLPEGADVTSISPDPLHRETVRGRQLVVWRRFFMRGDRIPWEIRYQL